MSLILAILLGIVQGLTEFLPVSSRAHIRIVGSLLGQDDPGARFTAIIQIGTEAAVILYFWRDIVRIIGAWFRSLRGRVPRSDPDARMGWLIIIGSVPIVVLGLIFQDHIEQTLRNLWIVATTLIVFGILLGLADSLGRRTRTLADLTGWHGVLFGLAQALALIPGVSRSGGTITAGRLLGYTREDAARYAFLLAIPAVMGSGMYELYKVFAHPTTEVFSMGETLVATVVSFVVGWAVIRWLMGYLNRGSFAPFVVYRVALGVILYALLGFGVLSA